jgi:hypothetical protein
MTLDVKPYHRVGTILTHAQYILYIHSPISLFSAIVGVGGLGHLAIQFANKWGCEVSVLSTSESKVQHSHFVSLTLPLRAGFHSPFFFFF